MRAEAQEGGHPAGRSLPWGLDQTSLVHGPRSVAATDLGQGSTPGPAASHPGCSSPARDGWTHRWVRVQRAAWSVCTSCPW